MNLQFLQHQHLNTYNLCNSIVELSCCALLGLQLLILSGYLSGYTNYTLKFSYLKSLVDLCLALGKEEIRQLSLECAEI